MVTDAGQIAVAADGTVLVSWPPDVVAWMGALVGVGRNATKRDGGLPRDVEAALDEFSRAVHASRQASRGEVTAGRQVRDSNDRRLASSASPTVTVQEAARMLNISESTVLRRKKRYGAEYIARAWHLSRVLVDADVRRPA